MDCECYGGPEDGAEHELPDGTAAGFVHGILCKHYVSDHPFVALKETPIIANPQVVVFYKYSFDPAKRKGCLNFIGYKK